MKQLISCPTCEINGKKSILGELMEDGSFSVMRFHNGYTKINSPMFAVICGQCMGTAYFRKPNDGTVPDHGTTWVHWEQFSFQFGTH